MTRLTTVLVIGAAMLAAAGSFTATVMTAGAPGDDTQRLSEWLRLPAEKTEAIRKADPDFTREAGELARRMQQEREALASLLEDPAATDDRILAQVEQVIAAHDVLERRVARHVLAIRPHLTPEQQKRLMQLCADGVRESGDRRWRGGHGESGGPDQGDGRRWRGGRGGAAKGDPSGHK